MQTQIKAFIIENPLQIEAVMNAWLAKQEDIEISQIYPLAIMNNSQNQTAGTPALMFLVIYRKEGWK
jgi:hypothetical protein